MVNTRLFLNTDQRSCFDENGGRINCIGSGQDGALNSKNSAPHDRFKPHEDMVLDQWTGVFWHKNANLPGFPLSHKEAFEFVQQMNLSLVGGRGDWRLPTRDELFSLISHQYINPSLPDNHPFLDTFHGYYWTGTTCARLPDQAWYIHLGGGRIYRGMKHGAYMVWPVAGNAPDVIRPKNRFVSKSHTFYDRFTEKTWLNDPGVVKHPLTWRQALDQIRQINTAKVAGHDDWRLPNIRELESLIDIATHSPALAPGCPFHSIKDGYWSATTSVYEPRYAWVLYTQDGAVGVGYKPQSDFFLSAIR